ncbi:MAG: hypothetical protein OMM_09393 [Candidatus Magnetoglobus multicellularis str. Araruama]|uniref:Uncharacterized protein n=1 Tax=Candidatus Magnetoglobus multicellularis str. Araruama TaxID=890399 RepID=A0A1V1P4E0_9BACT|nr:MAG: hypothetical protein OMM_09393 [Candidatus Magnetoglobus multicellularis str. Araruama]
MEMNQIIEVGIILVSIVGVFIGGIKLKPIIKKHLDINKTAKLMNELKKVALLIGDDEQDIVTNIVFDIFNETLIYLQEENNNISDAKKYIYSRFADFEIELTTEQKDMVDLALVLISEYVYKK